MKILFLSRWFPFPPDNGAKKRIYHLIYALAETHTVDLISFTSEHIPYPNTLIKSMCRRVDTIQYQPYNPHRLKALVGFVSPKPRFLVDTYQPEMAKLIASAQKKEHYDMVVGSQIDMAPYLEPIKTVPRLYEEIEIGIYADRISQPKSRIGRARNQLTWVKLSSYLKNLKKTGAGMTTASPKELQYLKTISSVFDNVRIIPNGVDLDQAPEKDPTPIPTQLIFAGALTYQANYDAIEYFLRDIFPLILDKRPDTQLFITGNLKNVDISQLPQRPGVNFTGYLQDVAPMVANSWVSIVPLRIGGGTRVKILESMGIGTPVVTTSKGMEGLNLIPDRDILIGDSPSGFADQVLKVIIDPELRASLSQSGRKQVQDHYDWKKIGATFREYVEELAGQPSQSPKPELYSKPYQSQL